MVVLPAPFGPSNAKISPGATEKLIPSTARVDPYARARFCTTMASMAHLPYVSVRTVVTSRSL